VNVHAVCVLRTVVWIEVCDGLLFSCFCIAIVFVLLLIKLYVYRILYCYFASAIVRKCNVRVGDEPANLHLLWVGGNVRFAHGIGYATDCARRLWLTPSRAASMRNVCSHVSVYVCCLVADVTDLVSLCDDRTVTWSLVFVAWWAARAPPTTGPI